MKILIIFIVMVILFVTNTLASSNTEYKFAEKYTVDDVLIPEKAEKFLQEYLYWEGKYFNIARKNGIAIDGWNITDDLEKLQIREHTASSKEALDLMVLVKILVRHKYAMLLISESDYQKAINKAVAILKAKITRYEEFNAQYPGYGGFLPWVKLNDDGKIEPTYDWNYRVPALDNGEWVWAIYATYKSLYFIGEKSLANRYRKYFKLLIKNAPIVFYDTEQRKIRGETRINNIKNKFIDQSNYSTNKPEYYLTDVHEGLLMCYFMTLFTNLSQTEKNYIWETIKFTRLDTNFGTVYEAWPSEALAEGSPHIKWTRLMVPELDNQMALKISENQEIIRSNLYSYAFPVSTNTPGAIGYTTYNKNVFAPYSSFSMIFHFASQGKLTDSNYGLAWLLNMLKTDKMQGPLGSGESFSVEPDTNQLKDVSFLLTADGKMLIWDAIMGGVVNEVRDGLKEDGLYESFISIVNKEYTEAFGTIDKINSFGSFQLPKGVIEGKWDPKYPPITNNTIKLFNNYWKYKLGQENWGDKTMPEFIDNFVKINYIPGDDDRWGWAGASFEDALMPTKDSALFLRGTGQFGIKLESDRTYVPQFYSHVVTLQNPDEWVKVPLQQSAEKPFYVMIIDQIKNDINLFDIYYTPDGKIPNK